MMKPTSTPRGKGPAKARRKTREEINQEARDRKRQKKHRGHAAGSRASGSEGASGGGNQNKQKDPRIGSKTPIPLGVTEAPVTRQQKPKSEKKPMLSPQAELDMLENDERLDGLLERLEEGETLSKADQEWVDAKLDRIDELMQQLGLSWDDEEDEEEENRGDDLMRLLKGGN